MRREDKAVSNPATAVQPRSIPNANPAVWDLVLADIAERDKMGEAKYGTRLQVGNGRDHLVDLYQELLDAVVYVRQEIERRRMEQGRIAELEAGNAALREDNTRILGLLTDLAHAARDVHALTWRSLSHSIARRFEERILAAITRTKELTHRSMNLTPNPAPVDRWQRLISWLSNRGWIRLSWFVFDCWNFWRKVSR